MYAKSGCLCYVGGWWCYQYWVWFTWT